MRTVTPQTAALLQQRLGTEPLLLIEVEWVDGSTLLYSDQDIAGAQAKIVSLGGFDTSMMLTGSSDSQEVSVTLDDTDGSLRGIYEQHDIHKRPARVYLLFKGLDVSHKMLMFKGEIVTPVSWDEAQRTVQFNILSKLDAVEAGFSMEEGDFPNIPEEALGKAWPLVFGQVCHMPAVQVRAPRRGYLMQGEGIVDFTLEPRICQAIRTQCPSQPTGTSETYTQGANNTWQASKVSNIGPDIECVNRRFGEICKLTDLKEQQEVWQHSTLNIYNGVSFPQNQTVNIFIEGAKFRGSFSGNTFTVTYREHPDFATFNHVPCREVPEYGYGRVALPGAFFRQASAFWKVDGPNAQAQLDYVNGTIAMAGWANQGAGSIYNMPSIWYADESGSYFKNTASEYQGQAFTDCNQALGTGDGVGPVGGPADSWKYYDEMEEAGFFWAPAGSEVFVEDEAEILYIASLLPGTVDGVAAYKTAVNGNRYLTEVPANLYTVYETDYNGYDVVEIGLENELSFYDADWDDQLYVSFTSSVGPNPCDIIQWLVEKYTNQSVDPTTFASVKAKLTNYPTNFYLLERMDVYELIRDIAYQSRCSVYVRNGVVYITYLSTEPTSVRTLTESDILVDSFVDSLSETEEVYTTHKITWRPAGADVVEDGDIDRKLVLKYNVNKYGTVQEDRDYYCYNIFELVLKSATFWLIRKANSWRMVEFKTPIRNLDLDIGDCITLDVDYFGAAVKCIIEGIQYSADNGTLQIKCWTPIRSGETTPYYWAWPSQQPGHAVWPMPDDPNGGAGYNFAVTPPVGHILLGGYHRDDQLTLTTGDLHPSDLDDVLPTVRCELSDFIDFDEDPPEIVARQIAQSTSRSQMETVANGGGGSAGSSKNDKKEDTEGSCPRLGSGCNYKVKVTWHTSHAQGQATSRGPEAPRWPDLCGGPCKCFGGCPSCYGKTWVVCHMFGASFAANSFASYMKSAYGLSTDGQSGYAGMWGCKETRVVNVKKEEPIYTDAEGEHTGNEAYAKGGCFPLSNTGDAGLKPGGETSQAGGLTGGEANNTVSTDNPYVEDTVGAPTNTGYNVQLNPYAPDEQALMQAIDTVNTA